MEVTSPAPDTSVLAASRAESAVRVVRILRYEEEIRGMDSVIHVCLYNSRCCVSWAS